MARAVAEIRSAAEQQTVMAHRISQALYTFSRASIANKTTRAIAVGEAAALCAIVYNDVVYFVAAVDGTCDAIVDRRRGAALALAKAVAHLSSVAEQTVLARRVGHTLDAYSRTSIANKLTGAVNVGEAIARCGILVRVSDARAVIASVSYAVAVAVGLIAVGDS